MDHSKFGVVPFENRNGSSSWRVGLAARRAHPQELQGGAEVVAERATLEVRAAQTEKGIRTGATTLIVAEVQEAKTVFHRLRERPGTLSFYVDFGLTTYKEPEYRKKLVDACADYVAAKRREFDHANSPRRK